MDSDFWELRGRDRVIHFIGIGGIGVSALARWFLAQGWTVTGSDLQASALIDELVTEGAMIKIGQKRPTIGRPEVVVHSAAVPPTNPEYAEAKRRGLRLFSYAQMVGELSRRYETVAVAGAHGKSTTTALVSLIFSRLGLDPTVLVGTKLREFGGKNFRAGKSRYLVLEADEYSRAFLQYSPAFLIITNIDREHLDIYHNLMDIKRTFLKLCMRVLPGGAIVLNGDDVNVAILRPDIEKIAAKNHVHVHWYSLQGGAARKVKRALQIPGRHNLADATAAFTLATKAFGLPEAKVLDALGRYQGSWRRFEYKGNYRLAKTAYRVFDDYAHHPTEIRETLASFKEKFPHAALVCVFQPHQADRLRRLFRDFAGSFHAADAVVMVPAYHVAGREQVESQYTAQALAMAAAKRNRAQTVLYLDRAEDLSRAVVQDVLKKAAPGQKEAVVVMMGAGTIVNYTPVLVGK